MRLLVADALDRAPLDELELLGVQLVHDPALTPEDLPAALRDIDILVVRETPVSAAAIEAAPGLNLIVRADLGAETVDVATASRHGIYVAHCPTPRAPAVAELTMGMLLALDRKLVEDTTAQRSGTDTPSATARGLYGRRIGLAGVGRVGQRVAAAGMGMGMNVYAWSRSLTTTRAQRLGVKRAASLRALASTVDVLSLHLPLTPSTRHIVDAEVLGALPEGATLLNCSHPALVDPEALAEVGAKRRLRVGVDLSMAPETAPPQLDDGLVYATRGSAGATRQAEQAIATEVTRIVRAFLTETDIPNVVNVLRNTASRYAIILRSRDEVGVLANVLGVIKRHGLNIEEIKNHVFDGSSAACTKLRISGRPGDDCLNEIRAFGEVFHVDVVPLPNLA